MSFPWYLHAAANLYQYRKRNIAITKTFAGVYTANKMLRGYRKQQQMVPRGVSRTSLPAYNSARLAKLERRIAGLKPEVKRISVTNQLQTSTFNQYQQDVYPITGVLAGLTDRYDLVSGDSWINKYMELNLNTNQVMDGFMRIIVYRPAKSGTTFTFSNINACLDPDVLTVYYDRTLVGNPSGKEQLSLRTKIPLKNLKSTYIGTTVEKGDVYMAVITKNNNTVQSFEVAWNWALYFADK